MGAAAPIAPELSAILRSRSFAAISVGLGRPHPDCWLEGADHQLGGAVLARLRRRVQERALKLLNTGRLATAIRWFDGFLLATRRTPFVDPAEFGERVAFRYNADTLGLFPEFIRDSPSLRSSHEGPVGSSAISGYVGAISGLAVHVAGGQNIVPPSADGVSTRALVAKSMRREDGPAGQRALCRGLRTSDAALAVGKVPRTSPWEQSQWAMVLAGQNLILRGGELGVVDGAEFDPDRDISLDSIQWHDACAESDGFLWAMVRVVSIKDTVARAQPHFIGVRRRLQGAGGFHELCVYDAIRVVWLHRVAGCSPAEVGRGALPLFVQADGSPVDTSCVKDTVRRFGAAVGIDPLELGARSLRIGGATDWMEQLGRDEARTVIRQRGRWASDCDLIYERALLRTHLAGSATLGQGSGRDLERALQGWVQPARRV